MRFDSTPMMCLIRRSGKNYGRYWVVWLFPPCARRPPQLARRLALPMMDRLLTALCAGVRWTYRVHEQILPSLNRAKVKVRWTDVVIRHDGYADPGVEARKLKRNVKILGRELTERSDDPFVLFNLGASAVRRKKIPRRSGVPGTQPGPFRATRLDRE
jgi:hypothetical protein